MPVRIAHRPAQPKTDGLSAATAIDLTDDPPHPPRPPSLPVLSVEASQRTSVVKPHKKRKRDEPGFEELTSHHKLTWWKNFHFKKLDIDREYNLVAQFPLASAKITTIVPHRYLRAVGISCERKRAKRQTKIPEFPGTVRILGPVEAVREAYEEHSPNNLHDPSRLVLWTDGSGHSGLSVVYRQVLSCGRQFGPWTCYGFNVPRQKLGLGSSDMEYLGLIKALDIVLDQTRTQPNRWKEYSIYTDAKTVLDDLKGRSRGRLVQHIVNKARAITGLGAVVRLHWVPGHSRVRRLFSNFKIANLNRFRETFLPTGSPGGRLDTYTIVMMNT